MPFSVAHFASFGLCVTLQLHVPVLFERNFSRDLVIKVYNFLMRLSL